MIKYLCFINIYQIKLNGAKSVELNLLKSVLHVKFTINENYEYLPINQMKVLKKSLY